jgi:hypothetical protein
LFSVPPKIVPFSFPNGTKEGDRILVSCAVSEGDEPMRLKWLKNNQVLGDTQQGDKAASASSSSSTQPNDHRHDMFPSEPTSGLSIRRYDDFALAILIDRVKATDSANYSCVASNSAEVVSQIAELVVHGNYSLKNNQQHIRHF